MPSIWKQLDVFQSALKFRQRDKKKQKKTEISSASSIWNFRNPPHRVTSGRQEIRYHSQRGSGKGWGCWGGGSIRHRLRGPRIWKRGERSILNAQIITSQRVKYLESCIGCIFKAGYVFFQSAGIWVWSTIKKKSLFAPSLTISKSSPITRGWSTGLFVGPAKSL